MSEGEEKSIDVPTTVFEAAYHDPAPSTADLERINEALMNKGVDDHTMPTVVRKPNPVTSRDVLPENHPRASSQPPPTFFGAKSLVLRNFDASNVGTRGGSSAPSPPRVSGIGGKGEVTPPPNECTPKQKPMILPSTGAKPDYSEAKIVVAMVGLPARGKSYLSNKLTRYLKWLEYDVKVFNVGQLRRSKAKERQKKEGVKEDHSASYFSNDNKSARELRNRLAEESLNALIKWLKEGGNVAIHDATNSTRERRAFIEARVAREPGLRLLFLESFCNDPDVIAANIALKVSSGDPDYAHMSPKVAEADFRRRIQQYESAYQPIVEKHLSYMKIINVGAQTHMNHINGYLQSRIVYYLMNLHLKPRSIFFSRHGESHFNVEGKIGGDSPLSPRGRCYAKALPDLIKTNVGDAPLTVWTSTLQRTIETAGSLNYPKLAWKSLDELDAGVCDGMKYEEIAEAYPEDFDARDEDKFNYRYRGGESYRDIVNRLEPVIMELERLENILIISHQAVLRCLYAYFHNLSQEDLPYIKIPLHTLIKLTPKAYGCDEECYTVPIAAVDTHRPKPKTGGHSSGEPNLKVPSTARQYFDPDAEKKGVP